MIFAHVSTLILNWNEDGIIYEKRKSEEGDFNLPMELNPWIRGFRLGFIILFTCVDVGMVLSVVSNSFNFGFKCPGKVYT